MRLLAARLGPYEKEMRVVEGLRTVQVGWVGWTVQVSWVGWKGWTVQVG